jgi:hypothetical protein
LGHALADLADLMDGQEWTPNTLDMIAAPARAGLRDW